MTGVFLFLYLCCYCFVYCFVRTKFSNSDHSECIIKTICQKGVFILVSKVGSTFNFELRILEKEWDSHFEMLANPC